MASSKKEEAEGLREPLQCRFFSPTPPLYLNQPPHFDNRYDDNHGDDGGDDDDNGEDDYGAPIYHYIWIIPHTLIISRMGHDDADDDYQHDGANDKSYVDMILVPTPQCQ